MSSYHYQEAQQASVDNLKMVEFFLQAAYCPEKAVYKLEVAPNYADYPGIDQQMVDKVMSDIMAPFLKRTGTIGVSMTFTEYSSRQPKYGPADFAGIFELETGNLRLFDRPSPNNGLRVVDWIYVRISSHDDDPSKRMHLSVKLPRMGIEVEFNKSEKTFHVISPLIMTD